MPRLIDADKYCEFLNTYPLKKAQENFMTFYRDALRHTFECEVEAITVEWLQKKYDKWIDKKMLGLSLCVKLLIEDWEKENAEKK